MEIDSKHEKCKTCKFFLQHYIKRNSNFWSINFGHCVNRQLNGTWVRNKYALHQDCEFWESGEGKKAERLENIKEVLRDIEKHLKEITIILKDDNN